MAPFKDSDRLRPRLNVTVPKDLKDRIDALAESLPGATGSAIVEECLATALPALEQVAAALKEHSNEDDARRQVEQFIGAQLLGLSDSQTSLFGKEKKQ